jgi:alkylated DNA repair dioxygenase AlkB
MYPISSSATSVLLIRGLHKLKQMSLAITDVLEIRNASDFSVEYTKSGNGCFISFTSNLLASQAKSLCEDDPYFLETDFVIKPPDSSSPTSLPLTSSAPSLDPNNCEIPGLYYYKNFLTESEELEIVRILDSNDWNTLLLRRVQHYGQTFDYLNKELSDSVDSLPPWLELLSQKIQPFLPNGPCKFTQMTVNEYLPKVGISPHCDSHKSIGPIIAVISLLSPIVFDMDDQSYPLFIEQRSLLVMTGHSRYGMKHGIAKRKADVNTEGVLIPRTRRISLTFRTYNHSQTCNCNYTELCDVQTPVVKPTGISLTSR